nr:DegV family protein [Anaerolineae bacterium]
MIKIVTDTNVNLPEELVSRFDITLVPAYVIFGQEELREGVDIDLAGVIARLDNGGPFPLTSQPPPADFEAAYRRILEKQPDARILSIHITGAQSGTVTSANRAADQIMEEFPDARVYVFDSRAFSIGQALMVREAAIMASLDEAVEKIIDRLADMRDRLKTYFVLDTVDYLYKGGRIGRAAHLVGSLLSIKPVLTVKDGMMESFTRFRTNSQAFNALRDLVLKAGEGVHGLRVAVGYAIRKIDAQRLADELREKLDLDVLLVEEVGPALGVYTGPGALGIAWYNPPQEE